MTTYIRDYSPDRHSEREDRSDAVEREFAACRGGTGIRFERQRKER
ncbi:hypothetical protein O1Q96_22615 [Streptomyces sp. Qhu-G9]|nr:hypothetical protein [Streptomyces aurantiacus]WAU82304.1 hypothetical protein O1Q96_22615 [Streptomyces aurantiacus]